MAREASEFTRTKTGTDLLCRLKQLTALLFGFFSMNMAGLFGGLIHEQDRNQPTGGHPRERMQNTFLNPHSRSYETNEHKQCSRSGFGHLSLHETWEAQKKRNSEKQLHKQSS
jgi:hypothetical protein